MSKGDHVCIFGRAGAMSDSDRLFYASSLADTVDALRPDAE